MSEPRPYRFAPGTLVSVRCPDDTSIRGTVYSVEDGRQLDAHHGGPYESWVYEVVPDGQATLWPRLRATEEQLERTEMVITKGNWNDV